MIVRPRGADVEEQGNVDIKVDGLHSDGAELEPCHAERHFPNERREWGRRACSPPEADQDSNVGGIPNGRLD